MGQIANILDATLAPSAMLPSSKHPAQQESRLTRLVPGSSRISAHHRLPEWFAVEDVRSWMSSLCATVVTAAVLHYSHSNVPNSLLLVAGFATFCALAAGRRILIAIVGRLNGPRNVLVVGSGAASKRIIGAVRRHPGSGRSIKQALSVSQFQEICDARRFSTFVRKEFIDEVIIATPGLDLAAVIGEARHQRLDVTVVPEALGLPAAEQIAIENREETTLLAVHKESVPSIKLTAKRVLDVLLSGIGLAALLPLLVMIGFVVRLDSSGPALYRCFRVGCKGRRFLCYKFRTMVLNADFAKEGLRWRNERVGAFFKIDDDPRITRVGKFLRRYSLDELPQLWNVLLGQMSLVGPRPHPPEDINLYRIQDLQRLDFMPGMTGLWQVTARQDPSFDTSVALDVKYIKGWSLWLDFQILCRTVGVVVRGSGS